MLRVTMLYASSASATAAYETQYLADAPGEEPGRWAGGTLPESVTSGGSRRATSTRCWKVVTPRRGAVDMGDRCSPWRDVKAGILVGHGVHGRVVPELVARSGDAEQGQLVR